MSVNEILRKDVKSKEDWDKWIEGAKGIAQEAMFAAENMLIRSIPSTRNMEDYQLIRRALWRLKRLDEMAGDEG